MQNAAALLYTLQLKYAQHIRCGIQKWLDWYCSSVQEWWGGLCFITSWWKHQSNRCGAFFSLPRLETPFHCGCRDARNNLQNVTTLAININNASKPLHDQKSSFENEQHGIIVELWKWFGSSKELLKWVGRCSHPVPIPILVGCLKIKIFTSIGE